MRNTPSTPSWSPRDHSLLLSGCSCTKCRGIHSLLAMDSLKVQLHMCGQCLSYPSTHRLQADVHSKPTAALASLCCAVLLVPAPAPSEHRRACRSSWSTAPRRAGTDPLRCSSRLLPPCRWASRQPRPLTLRPHPANSSQRSATRHTKACNNQQASLLPKVSLHWGIPVISLFALPCWLACLSWLSKMYRSQRTKYRRDRTHLAHHAHHHRVHAAHRRVTGCCGSSRAAPASPPHLHAMSCSDHKRCSLGLPERVFWAPCSARQNQRQPTWLQNQLWKISNTLAYTILEQQLCPQTPETLLHTSQRERESD